MAQTQLKLECEHDIITRNANSLSWTKLWEFSKLSRSYHHTKIIVFGIIRCADWYFGATSKLSSTFTTIQNDSPLQSPVINETESETNICLQ